MFHYLFGLLFGFLCAIPYIFTSGFAGAVAWWIAGIPWDIVHGISNFVIMLMLFGPIQNVMQKITPFSEKCVYMYYQRIWCIFIHSLTVYAIWAICWEIKHHSYWEFLCWKFSFSRKQQKRLSNRFDWIAFESFIHISTFSSTY